MPLTLANTGIMESGTPVQWRNLGRLFKGVVVQGPSERIYVVRSDTGDYLGNEMTFTVHEEKLVKL
jgi:hypothetical protein